jgi:signal transduction histidine kinase
VLLIGGLEKLALRLRETLERERDERTQLEAAQHALEKSRRLEALGELAAGVAHDFNNSLMVIMGGASVLRADPSATPAVAALADEIIERARTGAQTVQQLLSLGRASGGDVNAVTLDEVLRRTLPTLKQALSDNVHLELACAWQGVIHVDVGRLQQALLNLATNARDAMPHGGRWTLRVTEHQIERVPAGWMAQPGRFVALACIDTGVGVDGALFGRLFEPFFSTKAAGKGSGLGLAMVRKTLNDAGGFIEVESELGVGTTFRLFFPVRARALARSR